jgi:hypothetical protein
MIHATSPMGRLASLVANSSMFGNSLCGRSCNIALIAWRYFIAIRIGDVNHMISTPFVRESRA